MLRTYIIRVIGLILVVTGLLLFITVVHVSSADTIIVSQDGKGDYENIQDAIDAAEEGDTIRVWEGTYNENIVVDKTVSLVGNGSEVTTIDGGGSRNVVKISADWVNMSGFMVTGSGSSWSDAGIKIESDHNIIFNNKCSNNRFGIHLEGSNYNTLTYNTCSNNRYGIFLSYSSNDCNITNNTCSSNTNNGIHLSSSSDCTITNNTCKNNSKGIHLQGSSHCSLEYNICTSSKDTGIALWDSSGSTLEHNICSSNMDEGIWLLRSSNCTLNSNTCSSNNYNGIAISNSNDCTITNNTCSYNKDGISLGSSNCTIKYNTCTSNNDDGIYLGDLSSNCTLNINTCSNNNIGIGLFHSSNCTIQNNLISENKIGIYLESSSRDNTAHYNNIFNNIEYGIHATENDGFRIDATNNWWGHKSGSYHPPNNSQGKGDNVTDHVLFEPWLSRSFEEPPSEDEPELIEFLQSHVFFIFILTIVFIAGMVLRRRRSHSMKYSQDPSVPPPSPDKSATKPEFEEKTTLGVKICPKCHGEIPLYSLERPLKVTCQDCSTSFMLKEDPELGSAETSPRTVRMRKPAEVAKEIVLEAKKCPHCGGSIPITSTERPIKVSCSGCSASFTLKKKRGDEIQFTASIPHTSKKWRK